MRSYYWLFAFTVCFATLSAQTEEASYSEDPGFTEEEMRAMYEAYIDSISATLEYRTGTVLIGEGLATLEVPEGYKFLAGPEAEMVLTDLWGNPPGEPGTESKGMLFPENGDPGSDSIYVINITYIEDGYVDDSDAKDLDYDDLLEEMKNSTEAENIERQKMGYEAIELVGWASPPYYDSANKKLHWAKEYRFEGAEVNTLNYNIRILGRKGYLMMNVIGEMYVLDEVERDISPILAGIQFNEGHRYSDFNPNLDEVAAYGIGGLIAGKILAKAGVFAKLGVFLLKFWKLIAIGVVAGFAGIRKLFFGKEGGAPASTDV